MGVRIIVLKGREYTIFYVQSGYLSFISMEILALSLHEEPKTDRYVEITQAKLV